MKPMIQALIAFIILLTNQPIGIPETDAYQVIPDEAIRLRILADSDDAADQELKYAIRDAVNAEITDWVEKLTTIEQARQKIQTRLDDIDQIVADTIRQHGSTTDYDVDYNPEVLFPAKLYDRYVYPAGEYEAILITLGEGAGSNWWCVLFPPLCFLDFSAGTTVATEDQDADSEEAEESKEAKPKISFFFLEWFK